MATVLFVVKASITPDQEAAFNRWYNTEHCPELLQFKGAVSARRYKAIMGEDRHQYMAVYEFESEETFQRAFPGVTRAGCVRNLGCFRHRADWRALRAAAANC